MTALIGRGWTARLSPPQEQAAGLNQGAGSLRVLWTRLLEREKADSESTGTFLGRKGLQPLAVGRKREPGRAVLADLPAQAVLDTVSRRDGAVRRMGKERQAGRTCGVPKAKTTFVRESGLCCVGQAPEIGPKEAQVPKLGRIRLRGGSVPVGRLLSARLVRNGDRWPLSAPFECLRPEPLPSSDVGVGLDLGGSTLMTAHNGAEFDEEPAPRPLRKAPRPLRKAPRPLRKALRRLRRAQRAFSRRKKGSARRPAAARKVTAIPRRVRHLRQEVRHHVSHRLTAKAGVLKVETLNVQGLSRNRGLARGLALSVAQAGRSRLLDRIADKADWRGREIVGIARWFPGRQTCGRCGARHPEMKVLKRRTLVCACGNIMGRDRNASVNPWACPQDAGKGIALGGPTRAEIGDQPGELVLPAVPVVEARMLAPVGDHECQ